MTAIVDPVAAVRSVLLADTDVAALVSTRVYGGEVASNAVAQMPEASIVLNPAGGPSRPGAGFQHYGSQRIDLFAYGATLYQAWTVYLAVYGALKQMRTQTKETVLLHSVTVSSKGVLAVDPVTQWPTCLSSWLVLASEVAA